MICYAETGMTFFRNGLPVAMAVSSRRQPAMPFPQARVRNKSLVPVVGGGLNSPSSVASRSPLHQTIVHDIGTTLDMTLFHAICMYIRPSTSPTDLPAQGVLPVRPPSDHPVHRR